jgi:hypothetical protein
VKASCRQGGRRSLGFCRSQCAIIGHCLNDRSQADRRILKLRRRQFPRFREGLSVGEAAQSFARLGVYAPCQYGFWAIHIGQRAANVQGRAARRQRVQFLFPCLSATFCWTKSIDGSIHFQVAGGTMSASKAGRSGAWPPMAKTSNIRVR